MLLRISGYYREDTCPRPRRRRPGIFLLFRHKKPLFGPEAVAELTGIFEEQLAQKGEKLSDELDTLREERLLRFLLSDEVLDVVEPFYLQRPVYGPREPVHEDSAYWKGCLDRFDKIVTGWQVGILFPCYLQERRLQFAHSLLCVTALPVTEICYADDLCRGLFLLIGTANGPVRLQRMNIGHKP